MVEDAIGRLIDWMRNCMFIRILILLLICGGDIKLFFWERLPEEEDTLRERKQFLNLFRKGHEKKKESRLSW
jgi:hypothetical protein